MTSAPVHHLGGTSIMKFYSRSILVAVCILQCVLQLGCGSKQSELIERQKEVDELHEKERLLYATYFTGDANHARKSLEEEVCLLESSKALVPSGQAGALFVVHSRLYVLEKRLGNGIRAEANMIKARYWYLRGGELQGSSIDKVIEEIEAGTPERIMDMIDKLDKEVNNGNGPKYLQDIDVVK
jgi:hypothetical protein